MLVNLARCYYTSPIFSYLGMECGNITTWIFGCNGILKYGLIICPSGDYATTIVGYTSGTTGRGGTILGFCNQIC